MVKRKKGKAASKNKDLPKSLQNHTSPNLQVVTIKADKIKTSDFEASGVEVIYKFWNPNSQTVETQKIKKEETASARVGLFAVKQFISTFFQFILMKFPQRLP
jgi:hypothetical protein